MHNQMTQANLGARIITTIVLALAVAITACGLLPTRAFASDVEHQGVWGSCNWSIDQDGQLRVWPIDGTGGQLADSRGWNAQAVQAYFPWFEYRNEIRSAVVEPGATLPADITGMFYDCLWLAQVNAAQWDTSGVTDMEAAFQGCTHLTSLDVAGWDTSQVTSMSALFYNCKRLEALDVAKWDTSAATVMETMFYNCAALTALDVASWDVSQVTDMSALFSSCTGLTSLDVSSWRTGHATDMAGMFADSSALKHLDVAAWDTSQVTTLANMFRGCSSLAELDMSRWNTSSVASTYAMLSGCSSLKTVDLSGWDTSAAMLMDEMFQGCTGLESVAVGKGFAVDRAFPQATNERGWYSTAEGAWYTTGQIQSARAGVADVYRSAEIARVTIRAIDMQKTEGEQDPTLRVVVTGAPAGSEFEYRIAREPGEAVGSYAIMVTGPTSQNGMEVTYLGATFTIAAKPTTTQEMYRLYNPNSGEHFYTAKAGERDHLVEVGWIYEGVGWIAPVKSDLPVYRLYNRVAGDHHYTMNAGERNALLKIPGWVYEDVGWYSDDKSTGVPLYRQYNPNAVTGSHNYTTNKAENDALVGIGWHAEGIGWYGVRQ